MKTLADFIVQLPQEARAQLLSLELHNAADCLQGCIGQHASTVARNEGDVLSLCRGTIEGWATVQAQSWKRSA